MYGSGEFETVYDLHKADIFRFVFHLTGNRTEAEDLFQETWLRVVRHGPLRLGGQNLKPWLLKIVLNLHQDTLRRKRVRRMSGLLWALLVFIGNLIGLLIYLIVCQDHPVCSELAGSANTSPPSASEAAGKKPITCPACQKAVEPSFVYCPHCGASLRQTCPSCGKPTETGWKVCPHCGAQLKSE